MGMKIVRTLGAEETVTLEWFLISFTRCGGTLVAISTSPVWRADIRVVSSGIGRKIRVLIFGAPCHHCSLASSSIWSSLTHLTNLNAPVPTGFRASKALSCSLKYFGGIMAPRNVSWASRMGKGLAVTTWMVYLSF